MTIDEVWSWPSAIAAAIAGVVFVPLLAHLYRRPAARAMWLLVPVAIVLLAFVFTVSQVVAAWWVDDPSWVRVMSRFGPWVVMAIAVGVVLWIQARRRRHHA